MLINGRNLYIETDGPKDGHPIIFLHHGLGSTRAWKYQVPFFVNAGYQVVLYDRWGYGKSEKRPYLAVPDFEDDLEDLKVLIETLNHQPVTLIGHSDGGSIALYYAALYPDCVNLLVTVAAHIYLEDEMVPAIFEIIRTFEGDNRFRKGLRRAHGDKFESTFYNWIEGWKVPETREWDMRPVLSNIQCPALVIQGLDDEYATPQHAVDIAENITNSELWLVPGANHMLPQEIPEVFNRKVIAFIHSNKLVKRQGVAPPPVTGML